MTLEIVIALVMVGAFVGITAGLFGIGGGMVIVPALMLLFDHWHIPVAISGVMAVATSVACIVFTGGASALAHLRNKNVETYLLPKLALGVAVGGVLGTKLSDYLGGGTLLQVFSAFAFFTAYRMFKPKTAVLRDTFPKNPLFSMGTGGFIGGISNMIGIGGGILSVPLMVMFNIPMRIAIGTSSVLGVCLAIPGAISYLTLSPDKVVPGAIGYIHIPALLSIIAGSVFMAPVGAKLATHMDTNRLKQYWGGLVLVAGATILWRSLNI